MKTSNVIKIMMLVCSLTLVLGCKSTSTPQGVHPSAIPVGGGVDFEFEAPTDGVIFLVDSRNNQLVSSRSIRAGEVYRLGDDSLQLVRLIGLREHGPSFTLRTDFGEKETFPEVNAMKTPVFAMYFASLEQMQFAPQQMPPRAEPSIEELEQLLIR